MHFHGAYFSNYDIWLKDPKHYFPSAQLVWSLNSDVGNYFQGINITSGLFQLWRSEGIITQTHLKYASSASFIGAIVSLGGSYFHMHLSSPTLVFYKKFKSLSYHHVSLLFGLSSLSWAGHQFHIALPLNRLLDSGIDPAVIPCPQDFLFLLDPFAFAAFGLSHLSSTGKLLNSSTKSVFLAQVTAHHFYIAIVFIMSSLIALRVTLRCFYVTNSWHAQLSMNLAITASCSITFAHHIYAMPIYPYCASDYPTVLCLFVHHMWIGGFSTIGAGAHASIFLIADKQDSKKFLQELLNHRDIIIGHLIWVTLALGFHSFGLSIHNDTLQALGRPEDMFDDNAIQFKPLFASWVQSFPYLSFDIKMLDKKVIQITQELGTADFLVHHIHAFTIHTALLILSKGILYARSSRLVSDKLELGFRYPCDGPGRGGTCQISPWELSFG